MIEEIGTLMGREFSEKVLTFIVTQSGGHPYVARQLASLLTKRIDRKDDPIPIDKAQPIVERIFRYSDELKGYLGGIWTDLQKRNSDFIVVLNMLANNDGQITEEMLETAIANQISIDELDNTMRELLNLSLIEEITFENGSLGYRISIPLFYHWLKRNLKSTN